MSDLEEIRRKKMKELKEKAVREIEVNDGNFEEKVIKQSEKIPVVVDFWAQ